jgi:hypothetical protein
MSATLSISPKFMRPRRYAERVGINWRTIYQYIEQGYFPAYKFRGVLLLDIDECDAVIKGMRRLEPEPRGAAIARRKAKEEREKQSRSMAQPESANTNPKKGKGPVGNEPTRPSSHTHDNSDITSKRARRK